MNLAKTWNSVLGSLELQLPRIEYNTWLRRSELVHLDTQLAVVSVATHMLREAVETRYGAMIADQLKEILGYSLQVTIVVGPYTHPVDPVSTPVVPAVSEVSVAPSPSPSSSATSVLPIITDEMLEAMQAELAKQAAAHNEAEATADATMVPIAEPNSTEATRATESTTAEIDEDVPATVADEDSPSAPDPVKPAPIETASTLRPIISSLSRDDETPTQTDFFTTATRGMLNPRFTFDRFIIGSSNRLASAACMAVADNPAQAYNPLFLYGGVGLGKTHLLHAIGNAALDRDPEINVLYVSSEKFTNDLIESIRRQQTEEFRIRYRNIDILLIDDIQFIAGKDATQEEFFHTFNTLHTVGKQVVMTSDRPPKAILTLEERLRSRFEWGLIVDIQMPDYETRTAILRTKAEQMTVDVPASVIDFLAQRIQSNIRELEGSLNRVVAYAKLNGTAITVDSAAAALSDLLDTGPKKRVTGDSILRTVCEYYGVDMRAVQGRGRSRNIVGPRQVAMYLLREETDASLVDIGAMLGGRDHTTIMYGCDKIAEEITTDNRLKQEINSIRERLYQ
ncbi:MAG: chromosomal replication initiator protein DnaA [Roseiflexaceae bacterium]